MGDCECLTKCSFFDDQMAHMPALADQLKNRYCLRDWDTCARFRVFKALGPGRAPADLYPTQLNRVTEIIAAGSKPAVAQAPPSARAGGRAGATPGARAVPQADEVD